MRKRLAAISLLVVPAVLWCAPPQQSVPKPVLGAISGKVTDSRGVPQMGALVVVLAADGRVLHKLYTNEIGAFAQDHLIPGVYSLRVSLASFLPAVRDAIGVRAGSQAFISINLASLTDTLSGLIGKGSRQDSENDWKWVVRSSGGLRPVLRWMPGQNTPASVASDGSSTREEYRGRLEMAAGGSGSQGFGADADFSTRFSLAQTLFADTTLLLGGNLGFGTDSVAPASAFRGVIRRDQPDGSSNELSVTVRQILLPEGFVSVPGRGQTFMATSADFERTTPVTQWLSLVYGSSYDSLQFMGHVSSINPHARAVARLSTKSLLQVSYSQGPERERRGGDDALRDVSDQLTIFPQVSLRGGSAA